MRAGNAGSIACSAFIETADGRALWRVRVPGKPDRFMCLERGAADDDRFVVTVDAARFQRAWFATGLLGHDRGGFSTLCKRDMPSDYRYAHAARGFSHGRDNPVPLATAGANGAGEGAGLYFVNGVTRTMWLLANDAPAFPVEVFGRASAYCLHRLAGIGDAPISCADLFADDGGAAPFSR